MTRPSGVPDETVWGIGLAVSRSRIADDERPRTATRRGELHPRRSETLAHGYRSTAAWLYCEAGDLDRARELFDREAAHQFDAPFDSVWLQTVGLWSECAAALGRTDMGELLYGRLAPYSERFFFSGSHDIGGLARPLGRTARLLGRLDDAERHYRDALRLHEAIGAPYWLARTQLDLAELLVDGHRGDDEARTLAASALGSAEEHGYGGLARRATALVD